MLLRRRAVTGVLAAVALLLGAAATSVVLARDLVLVERARYAFEPLSAEEVEQWTLPPSVVGRADAEVLDVDRLAGRVSMDVRYVSAGRTQNVAWVDVSHLRSPPEPGDVVAVAYDPRATELVFDLDDPGPSDPQGNGYLAWAPRPPVPPVVEDLAVRAAVAGALGLAGCTVLVATVSAATRSRSA